MFSEYQFDLIPADELSSHQKSLEELEKHFTYPLEPGVTFTIDHGSDYNRFFDRMGKASFLVVRANDDLVGVLAIVDREILWRGRSVSTLYLADLKIHPDHQGKRLSQEMYRRLQEKMGPQLAHQQWEMAYFVTMQGDRGDVTKSAPPDGLIHLFRPLATLDIFFEPPERLAGIFGGEGSEGPLKYRTFDEPFEHEKNTLWLTPPPDGPETPLVDLSGEKDLIVSTTDDRLNFVHLGMTRALGHQYLDFLAQAGEKAQGTYDSCCFCIDQRRQDLLQTLRERGIATDSRALVYAFFPGDIFPNIDLVEMGTFEI